MLKRLDVLLTEKKLVRSRRVGRDLIKGGKVKVNGYVVKKQGKRFDDAVTIEVTDHPKYVSRAGYKLEKALTEFKIDVSDKTCLDVGASTGGFTDVLLQNGSSKVYAVEVGTGQLADEIRDDKRVISKENTDIRNVKKLPEKIDIAVVDVSFISLTAVLPSLKNLLDKKADIVTLIKPQFEVKKSFRKKGGIVRELDKRREAVERIRESAIQNGFNVIKVIDSPIEGAKGNREFLAHLTPN